MLNISKGELNENSYDKMMLTAYEVSEDTGTFAISLSRSGDGHSCTVQSFNTAGDKTLEIETDYKINSLSLMHGNIYVLEGNTVHCFDYNKNEISKGDAGSGAKNIKISSDGSVYVLGVNEIRKAKME